MAETEMNKLREDAMTLLRDMRGVIDEAIVKLDLGEKDLRDVLRPVLEKAENGWLAVKERVGL